MTEIPVVYAKDGLWRQIWNEAYEAGLHDAQPVIHDGPPTKLGYQWLKWAGTGWVVARVISLSVYWYRSVVAHAFIAKPREPGDE